MSDDGETAMVSAFAPGDPLPPWCMPAWDVLAARAASGSLPHALLVCGPAGLGKRALTEAFVRARLCESLRDGRACGSCRACRLLAAGTHPDRVLVTLEENPKTHKMRTEIVVDQVRALSARLAMASQLGGWQVAVIDPAEAMNTAAQNALLKTLEEPTASSLIVLVADHPWDLNPTVRSRCQRVEIALPTPAQATAWLESRGVADPAAVLAAAGGHPGQAGVVGGHPAGCSAARKSRATCWHWLRGAGMPARSAGRGPTTSPISGWNRPRGCWKAPCAHAPRAHARGSTRAGTMPRSAPVARTPTACASS